MPTVLCGTPFTRTSFTVIERLRPRRSRRSNSRRSASRSWRSQPLSFEPLVHMGNATLQQRVEVFLIHALEVPLGYWFPDGMGHTDLLYPTRCQRSCRFDVNVVYILSFLVAGTADP